ncbi:hypothetical protein EZY14_002710 [Kordia sp. TARA_039_SRF]|nr:hypothetical protein EZY14_002710 [Kordia sp. TARA_039_SRF]
MSATIAIPPTILPEIESLAAKNFAPSDIALKLGINKRIFMKEWRNLKSPVRKAYEKGKLEIAIVKADALEEMIEDGNVTAYQIHDKNEKEQAFKDVVADVFHL